MDLLLHNNLFERFFKSQNTLSDEKDILIYNIINNPNAKIIFNLDLQNDILSKAKNKKQAVKNFFSKLVHKKRVTKINANPTDGINSIYYESLKKEYNENTSENKFLIHIELNKTEDNNTEIAYIDEAINATKKSNDWLKVQLAAYSKCSVRYIDFANRKDLDDFLKTLLQLPSFDDVIVIDRYISFLKE